MTERRSSRPRLRPAASALAGAAAGALVGLCTVLGNPSLRVPGDAVLLAAYLALVYALLALVLGLLCAVAELSLQLLFARRSGGARAPELPLSSWQELGAYLVPAFLGLLAYPLVVRFALRADWRSERDAAVQVLGLVAALAAQLCLGFVAARARGRAAGSLFRVSVVLALLVIGASLACSWSVVRGRAAPAIAPPAPLPATARLQVLLLGVDGLEWDRIYALIDRGQLPHLTQLIQESASGRLQTLLPTWSPIIWTTIATGMEAEKHGIYDFTEIRLPGLRRGIQRLRKQALLPAGVGIVPLVKHLHRAGLLRELPITARQREVKALWNVLSDQGRRVGVVNWFATWPSEVVDGYIVSDNNPARHAFLQEDYGAAHASQLAISHPPELIAEIGQGLVDEDLDVAAIARLPFFDGLTALQREELDPESYEVFEQIHRADLFAVDAALYLQRTAPDLDLLAVYLSGIDNVSHRFQGNMPVVDSYYDHVDGLLAKLIAGAAPGTTIVLVSDHGWSYRWGIQLGHDHAPDGVILVRGAGIAPGTEIEQASVRDVAPTVLALLGLPPSREMDGRVLTEALGGAAPLAPIASYGSHAPRWGVHVDSDELRLGADEQMERLRALGYVK